MTSIVNYLAWKLAAHGLNATGKTTIVSAGGDLSRYPAGRRVRLNRVIGHGTVGLTACPGDALAKLIVQIRRRIQARIDEFGGRHGAAGRRRRDAEVASPRRERGALSPRGRRGRSRRPRGRSPSAA